MWYANAGNAEHKKKVLNRLPKLSNGRNMPEIRKVVEISSRIN
jgi:hypothetical protein